MNISRSRSGLGYQRHGEGPAVVLLHGIPGSSASWHAVRNLLARDHDVVIPDLLGFGSSHRPRELHQLHATAQAAAVELLLDELRCSEATVVGHDFGGPVALLLARSRPDLVARLALFATNAFTDTPVPFPLSTIKLPLVGRLAAAMLFSAPSLRLMLRVGVGQPSVRLDAAAYIGDQNQRHAIGTIFDGSLRHLSELYAPVEAALGALRIPTHVGWGDRDPFFSVEHGRRTATALNATFEILPQAGHFLPEERPTEVAAAIRSLATTRTG
jgi:pimeloyl-ACP methyl ester carboxylesterase